MSTVHVSYWPDIYPLSFLEGKRKGKAHAWFYSRPLGGGRRTRENAMSLCTGGYENNRRTGTTRVETSGSRVVGTKRPRHAYARGTLYTPVFGPVIAGGNKLIRSLLLKYASWPNSVSFGHPFWRRRDSTPSIYRWQSLSFQISTFAHIGLRARARIR